MDKRRCRNCVYAVRLLDRLFRIALYGWPGLLACANHPDNPGRMMGVSYVATCRNFHRRWEPPLRIEPPEPPGDDVRYIALTQGKYAIVDAADYEWLNQHRWHASTTGTQVYAYCTHRGRNISMHQFIMRPPKGMVVDHIDGNGLNNRRCNLRICTVEQNVRNFKGRRKKPGATSRFIGVYRYKGKWYARVQCADKRASLGPFNSEAEAAIARDLKAIELHGPYACLNFPDLAESAGEWPGRTD